MCKPVDASHRKQRGRTAPNRALSSEKTQHVGFFKNIIQHIVSGMRSATTYCGHLPVKSKLLSALLTVKTCALPVVQYIFAVLPATVLISKISGTQIAAGFVSAGIGTLVFLLITKFKVPMCTSNSGATVSAITGVIALTPIVEQQFTGIVLGGVVMALIYCIAGLLVKKFGTDWISKLMPPIVSGTIILVIGCVLGFFVPGYAQVNGEDSALGLAICFGVMIVTTLVATYGKGVIKTLPFLIGLVAGYVVSIILTLVGTAPLVDFSRLNGLTLVKVPDLAMFHLDFVNFDYSLLPEIIARFGLVSLAAMTEHVADVQTAGSVTGQDYVKEPGLHRTLIGDGLSSLAGALTGAQMTTTYSEYTGTMAVSKVYSPYVTLATALSLIALGFFQPFNVFLAALPNCVFAGVAICAYGMIAVTGLQNLVKADINFGKNKNRFIIACTFIAGTCGLKVFGQEGIVLAMIVGIGLNLICTVIDAIRVRIFFRYKKKA